MLVDQVLDGLPPIARAAVAYCKTSTAQIIANITRGLTTRTVWVLFIGSKITKIPAYSQTSTNITTSFCMFSVMSRDGYLEVRIEFSSLVMSAGPVLMQMPVFFFVRPYTWGATECICSWIPNKLTEKDIKHRFKQFSFFPFFLKHRKYFRQDTDYRKNRFITRTQNKILWLDQKVISTFL